MLYPDCSPGTKRPPTAAEHLFLDVAAERLAVTQRHRIANDGDTADFFRRHAPEILAEEDGLDLALGTLRAVQPIAIENLDVHHPVIVR